MDSIATVVELLTKADPAVLVAVVCIVALLVVAECVKTLGKNKKEGE
jgi:hypothetical protein